MRANRAWAGAGAKLNPIGYNPWPPPLHQRLQPLARLMGGLLKFDSPQVAARPPARPPPCASPAARSACYIGQSSAGECRNRAAGAADFVLAGPGRAGRRRKSVAYAAQRDQWKPASRRAKAAFKRWAGQQSGRPARLSSSARRRPPAELIRDS